MKKTLTSLAIIALSFAIATAQTTPNVTLKAPVTGKNITIRLITNLANQTYKVDWGDGQLVETDTIYQGDALSTADQKLCTLVTGQATGEGEVKIYGEGITFFHINKLGATALDLTNAPDVEYLFLSNNPNLTELDLSKSTKLQKITLTKTGIKSLDFSHCPDLTLVQATSGSVESVDLSQNTKLEALTLTQCNLTSIDFSACTALTTVKLQQNELTEVRAPYSLPSEATVNISKNRLRLSDLPSLVIKSYTYAPQEPMQVAEGYRVNDTLDLSDQDNLRGVKVTVKSTTYTMETESGTALTEGEDYSVTGGVITLLRGQTEPVRVVMATEAFPYFKGSYKYTTTYFTVAEGTTGLTAVTASPTPLEIYGVDGTPRATLSEGINIVKYSDGTVRKIAR